MISVIYFYLVHERDRIYFKYQKIAVMKKILNIFCTIKAFSLIELMISLITISCIVAAFMPVISKKLSSSNVTISGNNVSDITTECTDKFSSNCKLCTKSYCIQCELSTCPIGQYAESKSCSCKNCSDIFSNCSECDSTKCTKCKDNNYYINNGKCETCPTGKICDGINAYDESYCINPPDGYYCDNNNIKRCVDKYGMYCATCNSSSCLSCNTSYYLSNGNCLPCSSGCYVCTSSSYCTKCGNWLILNTTTHKCDTTCSSVLSNCAECSNASTCTKCSGEYYINSQNKCSPCSDISNCLQCSNGSTCTMCNAGYYINSLNKCSKCTISNCATCNTDGTCLACNSDYYLSDDKKRCIANDGNFNCSDSNFMKIGNLCVTRKNMGDSTTLTIPSSITTVNGSGDYCYSQTQKCCWKGGTTISTACNSNNGSYSGCNRTVCNYAAAEEICAKFNYAGKTWRLATRDETQNWGLNTFGINNNGLMLCGHNSNTAVSTCNNVTYCKGAYSNTCASCYVWLSGSTGINPYIVAINDGKYTISLIQSAYGASVRCVTEME